MANMKKLKSGLRNQWKTVEQSSAVLEHYGDVLYKLGRTEETIIYWKALGG